MFKTEDICSLTEFQRNAKDHIERLQETGRPEVLTRNGEAEIVVQGAEAYQELLDRVDRAEAILGIQRGLTSMRQGEGEPMEEVFAALREELGVRSTVEQ